MKIFVVKLGWVLVGYVESDIDGRVELSSAQCIRKWGTTKGLGELAFKGPLKETILEPMGFVTIERHSILFSIECKEGIWSA